MQVRKARAIGINGEDRATAYIAANSRGPKQVSPDKIKPATG